jgi:hypothetical protein
LSFGKLVPFIGLVQFASPIFATCVGNNNLKNIKFSILNLLKAFSSFGTNYLS